MAYGTIEKIETITVGSGGAASIDFTNIPQTYDDLLLNLSLRDGTQAAVSLNCRFKLNGSTTFNTTNRWLRGSGSAAATSSGTDISVLYPGTSTTASTFGSTYVYFSSYANTTTNKSFSVDCVTEHNATEAYAWLAAGFYNSTSAISRINIFPDSTNIFAQHSTATLYGITRVPTGAKATGGIITDDSSYWYHTFTSSGVFTPNQSLSCDVLVIAGGGSGGSSLGGGGGAGGLLGYTSQSLIAQNYTITIGAGGAAYRGATPVNSQGSSGSNSQFASLTASIGGGRGGTYNTNNAGASGGSGGGAGGSSGAAASGGAATSGQGNNGAAGGSTGTGQGGGGGAGASGSTYSGKIGGAGGAGSSSYSSWGLATNTGENSSGTFYFAGGGGGCMDQTGTSAGGLGGGGVGVYTTGSAGDGIAFTGGGGGGHRESATPTTNGGGNGGSGIVIVRYAK